MEGGGEEGGGGACLVLGWVLVVVGIIIIIIIMIIIVVIIVVIFIGMVWGCRGSLYRLRLALPLQFIIGVGIDSVAVRDILYTVPLGNMFW